MEAGFNLNTTLEHSHQEFISGRRLAQQLEHHQAVLSTQNLHLLSLILAPVSLRLLLRFILR